MRNIFIFLMMLWGGAALASATCTTSNTGTTYCTGTDSAGAQISTESRTSNTGTTTISGHNGERQITRECRTSNTGTTYCE